MDKLKSAACEAIDNVSEGLHQISQDIWNNPELNYEEHHAHKVLTDFLENQGFNVERKYKIDTAFRAVYGSTESGPHVSVLCEYDALPEIGHACGHNLIAEAGVAAGIGIKAAFEAAGKPLGKVTVLGTPNEENYGGKIDLLNAGAFEDFDVSMMVHPRPLNLRRSEALCLDGVTVKYHGHAVHAAAFPWQGVNALDAAVLCYQTVSCMRQQMKPTWRVHGIITNGGAKPNIIPEYAELEFYIRAPTKSELEVLKEKIIGCFESAATGTGCKLEYTFSERPYLNVVSNKTLEETFVKNAALLGLDFADSGSVDKPMGSTDMGNVSHVVPSIHPFFYIGTSAVNHTRDFTTASGDVKAQPYTLKQGKIMACTALDVFSKPDLLAQIKQDFENDKKNF